MKFKREVINISIVIAIIIGFTGIGYTLLNVINTNDQFVEQEGISVQNNEQQKSVVINNHTFIIEVADTPEKMLFPYINTDTPAIFWMKGMVMSIDIIWIKDNEIIRIDHNVPPEPEVADSDLTRYSPFTPVDYVLEIRGGLSEKNGFHIGDRIEITF
jgi:hypothetical protein